MWAITNDGVMGGATRATLSSGWWEGELAPLDSGELGFTSIEAPHRTRRRLVRVPVWASGQRLLRFELFDENQERDEWVPRPAADVRLGPGWQLVQLDLARDFERQHHGHYFGEAWPFSPAALRGVRLVLSDDDPAPFAFYVGDLN